MKGGVYRMLTDKITIIIHTMTIILLGIYNQRRPRMEQRSQFSGKFIRFYHISFNI